MRILDVNANNINISKLVETSNTSKLLNEYLDIRPLALILPKTSGYVTTFKGLKKIHVSLSR